MNPLGISDPNKPRPGIVQTIALRCITWGVTMGLPLYVIWQIVK